MLIAAPATASGLCRLSWWSLWWDVTGQDACVLPAWTWTPGLLSPAVHVAARFVIFSVFGLFVLFGLFSCAHVVQLFHCGCPCLSFFSVIQVPSKNTIKGPKMTRPNFLLERCIMKPFILNQIDSVAPFRIWPAVKVVEGEGLLPAYSTALTKVNVLLGWSNLIQALFNLMCINKTFT